MSARSPVMRCALVAAFLSALLASCANDDFAVEDGSVVKKEAGEEDWGTTPDLPTPVVISGKVLAPNKTMPISGALVYAVTTKPDPIPQEVFCDKCVELPQSTPHTTSGPDGVFKLKLHKGKWILVTQKGAFRRYREIEVTDNGLNVPEELTTLPSKTDQAKGDNIPKMAVIKGAWDAIQNSLAKLGLGKVDTHGSLVKGSESFTMHDCDLIRIFPPKVDCKPMHPGDLFKSYEELSKYQIIFVPCDSDWLDGNFADQKVQDNLRKWIKDGGRLYVTDYQYDLLQKTLPGYIIWEGESSSMGSAELENPYDAPAIVQHPDLKGWLTAQGITNFKLLESYTIVDKVTKLPTPGPDEKPYDVLPQAWILGDVPGHGIRPATVSYPYGCGRILFSTYHTEGDKTTGTNLLPQERALLYIILEVAVCIKEPVVE